jgi:hypothetical protein
MTDQKPNFQSQRWTLHVFDNGNLAASAFCYRPDECILAGPQPTGFPSVNHVPLVPAKDYDALARAASLLLDTLRNDTSVEERAFYFERLAEAIYVAQGEPFKEPK